MASLANPRNYRSLGPGRIEQMAEVIDIEALLVRAYREKRIDRLGGGAAAFGALGIIGGPRLPGATMTGGEKVDTSSYAARMASEMREMFLRLANAPDALLTLHDAVLALPDFYVELGVGLDFVVWDEGTAIGMGHLIEPDRETPTIAKVRRRAARDGKPAAFVPVGPARRVHRIVTTTLLVTLARECDRPDVSDVVVTRMRPIYRGLDKRAVGHEPEYLTPLDVIAVERARYAVWHAALAMLVERLVGLPGFEVTGPHAPAAPWEAVARVLRSRAPRKRGASKALTGKKKRAPKPAKKAAL